MKVTFIGAGAHRHLPVIRGVMAKKRIMDGGEICLYDLNTTRSRAMAAMLMKTPEYKKINCTIKWDITLEEALDGADGVQVVLMAGSRETYALGCNTCWKRGYIGSDNISASGAILALKGGVIIMDIAQKMEKLCPKAWLMVFVNPVAVLSGAVNNHTKIKALGICEGYQNHGWDLMRLMGIEEECLDFKLDVAGVNHMSFILKGTLKGKDIFGMIDRAMAKKNWSIPKIDPVFPGARGRAIARSMAELAEVYRRYRLLVFSSEGDGFTRIFPEYWHAAQAIKNARNTTSAQIRGAYRASAGKINKADKYFESFLDKDLDKKFWDERAKNENIFRRRDNEITVHILNAICSNKSAKIVTSFPNRGAVENIDDRYILEYSQKLNADGIKPAGRYRIPEMMDGLVTSMAAHQTLLGDAIAAKDPKLLAQAFYCYPERRAFTKDTRKLFKDLIKINAKELAPEFVKVMDYL